MRALLSSLMVIGLLVAPASLSADVSKGQKLFTKKLKASCGISGAAFAGKHTQAEWAEIGKGGIAAEIQNICPDVEDKALKEKYLEHYYDFVFEYANDSGNIPAC
jgi:hypothetical protein